MVVEYSSKQGLVKVIKEYIFLGKLDGSFVVEKGGILYQKGIVFNNVILEKDSSAIISGTVKGDVINNGGKLGITAEGMVLGEVVTNSGNTQYIL